MLLKNIPKPMKNMTTQILKQVNIKNDTEKKKNIIKGEKKTKTWMGYPIYMLVKVQTTFKMVEGKREQRKKKTCSTTIKTFYKVGRS